MTFRIRVIGTNHARQIEEMHLVCYLKFNTDKCKHPVIKVDAIKEELETIVNKYFDLADICDAKPVVIYSTQ